MEINVTTQLELDAALALPDKGNWINCRSGSLLAIMHGESKFNFRISAGVDFRVVARDSSQPHMVAWDSSQPHVVAWDSSQPHVVAWDSSQPHVEAWGSSQPHVVARDSSQPHVEARGYVQLAIFGRVVARCSAKVSVLIRGTKPLVDGGIQTTVEINTPVQWCDYYGVEISDGIATLFKAVDDDFVSPHGTSYEPGSTPVAPDWDGMARECGGGLHFSPSPIAAMEFNERAKRFVACGVRLSDIVVHPDGEYPQKIKAKEVAAPCYEVDRQGKRI